MSKGGKGGEARADLGFGVPGGLAGRLVRRALWPYLRHQVDLNGALMADMDALGARLAHVEAELARARGDLEHHTAVLVRHEEPLDRHEFLLGHLEPAFLDLQRAVDLVHDKVDLGQRQSFARHHEGMGSLQGALAELAQRLADLEAAGEDRGDGWRQAWAEASLRLGQLDLFLTEARRSFPDPPPVERLAALPSGFEGLRGAFDEAFRGPRPVIEARARCYVADLASVTCRGPVLDLGCGRGELLGVLSEAGIEAYGLDTSPGRVAECVEAGFDARREDARDHLRGLPERSLAAVTALHLVEHLDPDELIELLSLAARAVRPGGLVILESPNPENLVVAASSFYLDPTHRRPVPAELLAFLVGSRGFDQVQIRRLERPEQPPPLSLKPDEGGEGLASVVEAVNAHLFAPADYAVLARRP